MARWDPSRPLDAEAQVCRPRFLAPLAPRMLLGLTLAIAMHAAACTEESPVSTPVTRTPTPVPTVAVATPEASTYIVQSGDYLAVIADRFGVSIQEIAALNGITDPTLIEVGQVLRLPGDDASGTGGTDVAGGTGATDPPATPEPTFFVPSLPDEITQPHPIPKPVIEPAPSPLEQVLDDIPRPDPKTTAWIVVAGVALLVVAVSLKPLALALHHGRRAARRSKPDGQAAKAQLSAKHAKAGRGRQGRSRGAARAAVAPGPHPASSGTKARSRSSSASAHGVSVWIQDAWRRARRAWAWAATRVLAGVVWAAGFVRKIAVLTYEAGRTLARRIAARLRRWWSLVQERRHGSIEARQLDDASGPRPLPTSALRRSKDAEAEAASTPPAVAAGSTTPTEAAEAPVALRAAEREASVALEGQASASVSHAAHSQAPQPDVASKPVATTAADATSSGAAPGDAKLAADAAASGASETPSSREAPATLGASPPATAEATVAEGSTEVQVLPEAEERARQRREARVRPRFRRPQFGESDDEQALSSSERPARPQQAQSATPVAPTSVDSLSLRYRAVIDLQRDELEMAEAVAIAEGASSPTSGPSPLASFNARPDASREVLEHLLDQACRFAARCRDAGLKSLRVGVPVNRAMLNDPEFPDLVMAALKRRGLTNRELGILVPAEAIDDNVDAAAEVMNQMRLRGLQSTLVGVSSVSHGDLARIGFYSYRIDLPGPMESAAATARLTAFIETALQSGLPVFAAGVRTPADRDRLTELRCTHEVQEDLLSGRDFLERHAKAPAA